MWEGQVTWQISQDETQEALASCFSSSQVHPPSTTCQVALTLPCSEKELGEINISSQTTEKYLKREKSFPAKQEEQEEGKFAQSWLHSAGRGKGTAGNFAFLPICFAFARRGRAHQGQGAHRSGNHPWILSVMAQESASPYRSLDHLSPIQSC